MIHSSTLGSQIGRRRKPRKIYPEKLCAFCGATFVPKNGSAMKTRYFCYDPKCEDSAASARAKANRQRRKDRLAKEEADGNAI